MYVCGMTVYDLCHLGHARVMVIFDMVRDWLRASGYEVTYVRNITDIDDKIISRANDLGENFKDLTERFITAMNEDAAALGVSLPDVEPRATDNILQMIDLIQALVQKKHAYIGDSGDVYYSVKSFENYGQLSGKSLEDLRAGERVDVNLQKQHPMDFVLWKSAKEGEPSWSSPWGNGRPGWHIECSAMSKRYLGSHFDIHGGGQDLQFPHHDNEIAQSEAAHDKTYVNYWMHNGFVRVDDQKMSKSLDNFFTVREILKSFDAEVVRFFILRAHYRSPLNYSDKHLEDARNGITRMYAALKGMPEKKDPIEIDWGDPRAIRFKNALDDDFNTPEAIAVLFDLVNEVNREKKTSTTELLKALANQLGFLRRETSAFFQDNTSDDFTSDEIDNLIKARNEARQKRQFDKADALRDELLAKGITLEDSQGSTTWRRSQ